MRGAKYTHKRTYRDDHSLIEEEVTEIVKTRKVKKTKKEKPSKIKSFFKSLFR